MHPSETELFLLTRVLAYALRYQEGLTFSPGLSTADEPAISLTGPGGKILEWIEIGNPAARRLHKAAKAAGSVHVFTYKDPAALKRELAGETIHRSAEIRIAAVDPDFLERLSAQLARDNRWSLLHQEGELTIAVGSETFHSTLAFHTLD